MTGVAGSRKEVPAATAHCAGGQRVAAAGARWRRRTREKATRRNGSIKRSGPGDGAAGPPAGGRKRARPCPSGRPEFDFGGSRCDGGEQAGGDAGPRRGRNRTGGPCGSLPVPCEVADAEDLEAAAQRDSAERGGSPGRREGRGAPAQVPRPPRPAGGAWLRSHHAGASRRGRQRDTLLKTQGTGGWTPCTGVRKTPATPRQGALREGVGGRRRQEEQGEVAARGMPAKTTDGWGGGEGDEGSEGACLRPPMLQLL